MVKQVLSKIFLLIILLGIGGIFLLTNNAGTFSPSEKNIPPLSLERIFDDELESNTYSQNKIITLLATGDVIPARTVNAKVLEKQNFLWPWEKVADVLKEGDITVINMEAPLIPNCPLTNEGMIFCGEEGHVDGLLFAGIDIVNVANNHTGNYGRDGLTSTKEMLERNNIQVSGVMNENAVFKTVKGISFAFLGYDDIEPLNGVTKADEETMRQEIADVRKKADVVIVQLSAGVEYTSQPSDRQKDLAHLAIDSGADLIIGNHPHWIQPVEIYNGKLITYAHGNFIFDQMWSEKTQEGVVGKYTFYGKDLLDAEFLPMRIFDFGQPRFITDRVYKNRILTQMREESEKLSQ